MELIMQSVGGTLIGVVSLRVCLELLRYRLTVTEAPRLTQEAVATPWEGYRPFRIQRKVQEAQDICSFYLAPVDQQPLPAFKPGQHLTFRLNIPDFVKPIIRCYSLSESPHHLDAYRVSVKKMLPPPDKPDVPSGLGSTFFHDHLQEGDILDVKAPSGTFVLNMTKDIPVVLIAGGVGLTPLLSILNTLIESGSTREVWLFYAVRNRQHHMMQEHLSQLSRTCENLHLHVCYSEPTALDRRGQDYDHDGCVTLALLQRVLPSKPCEFYLCGPPPMVESLRQDLHCWEIPKENIFFEKFGSAIREKISVLPVPPPTTPGLEIVFAKSGKSYTWNQHARSLLEFGEANGIPLDFGCREGNCGTCRTAILSGEVDQVMESGVKLTGNSCLTCISIPKSHLILNA